MSDLNQGLLTIALICVIVYFLLGAVAKGIEVSTAKVNLDTARIKLDTAKIERETR